MIHINKILYIGTGLHIEPVTHFKDTKEFIFIDTQPRSEFDSFHPNYHAPFYHHNFINKLKELCFNYGFTFDSFYELDSSYYKQILNWKQYFYFLCYKIPNFINPTLLVFINKQTKQTIKYYVSTNIKFNMTNALKSDIETSDGLIVCGYIPEIELLQFFDKSKIFLGYTNTNYIIDEKKNVNEIDNNIVYFLQTCLCNTPYYFKDFYIIDYNNGVNIQCNNFTQFVKLIKNYKTNV